MYRFVELTDEQKHQRREKLDWYGLLAQFSVLVPLLVIQVFFLASRVRQKLAVQSGRKQAPSSPHAKHSRLEQRFDTKEAAKRWRLFAWWCGDSFHLAGCSLGTKGELLGAASWIAWLLILTFLQTGDDYLHLTKRFGAIASSQLPFHYLLSLKTPYSPLQLLARRSHESMISLHQILGRIITILMYAHAALYLNFYIQNNLLAVKLGEFYVLCGVFATVAFTTTVTTALQPVRDWSYRVFYTIHVALAILLLPTLYFHVHHVRVYIYETLAIYIVHTALRSFGTTTYTTGKISQIPGTDLVDIAIPLDGKGSTWQPGQHAYLSLKGHPLLRTFRSNPFTVASIPSVDGQLRFIARILDGNTIQLAQSTKEAQNISVEGPYGLTTHADDLMGYDRVLFVAGGVGATFIVSLYRQLLADLSPGKGSHRRQKVSFLWVARSLADAAWALPADEKEREGFAERATIHLTRDAESTSSSPARKSVVRQDEEDGPGDEGIEMEEQTTLLSSSEDGPAEAGSLGISIRAGRPNLAMAVEQLFSHGGDEKVAILVCGPRSLRSALRGLVGPWVKKGRDVRFWEEAFGL